jgi:hypothetical protein
MSDFDDTQTRRRKAAALGARVMILEAAMSTLQSTVKQLVTGQANFARELGDARAARQDIANDVKTVMTVVVGDPELRDGGLRKDVQNTRASVDRVSGQLASALESLNKKDAASRKRLKTIAIAVGSLLVMTLPKHGPDLFALIKSLFL